jgi:uncharacterized protein YhfF
MYYVRKTWNFGDNKVLAIKLKQLILSGKKRATTGLYQKEQRIPKVGEYEAILDSNQKRFCIIRVTNVKIKPFLEVDYDFIQKEGEGDQTINEWRAKHRKFFDLKDDNSNVICEEFEVVEIIP